MQMQLLGSLATSYLSPNLPSIMLTPDTGNQHAHGCDSQRGPLWLPRGILSVPVTSVMKLPSCQRRCVQSAAVKMAPLDERRVGEILRVKDNFTSNTI